MDTENLISVMIADDDPAMRGVMRKIIQKAPGFALVGEASDGDELLALFEERRPKVVMLDVEMPGKTGVECARILQDTNPRTILIFATAHEGYMGDAFEVYAFDYLLKPFKVERALATLQRIRDRLSAQDVQSAIPPLGMRPDKASLGRLMLRNRDGAEFLNMRDILLVQRENRLTVLYTADGARHVATETLAELEEKLDSDCFFRCHKSYIINLSYIHNITPYGRWTYVVKLRGIQQDALITHDKYEELQRMFV